MKNIKLDEKFDIIVYILAEIQDGMDKNRSQTAKPSVGLRSPVSTLRLQH